MYFGGEEVQDYKDRGGLTVHRFESLTGCEEIKIGIMMKL